MPAEPNLEYVGGYERYVRRARALIESGDVARAHAFGAVASALQLYPPHAERNAPRGQYLAGVGTTPVPTPAVRSACLRELPT